MDGSRASTPSKVPAKWTNDIGDPKEHPIYIQLKTQPNAQKAFVSLCKRQHDDAGRFNVDGDILPFMVGTVTPALLAKHRGSPEEAYARPEGSVSFSRSFFPKAGDMTKHTERYAQNNIDKGSKTAETDLPEMVELMHGLRQYWGRTCTSVLHVEYNRLLQACPIKANEKEITSLFELKAEWHKGSPSAQLAERPTFFSTYA